MSSGENAILVRILVPTALNFLAHKPVCPLDIVHCFPDAPGLGYRAEFGKFRYRGKAEAARRLVPSF